MLQESVEETEREALALLALSDIKGVGFETLKQLARNHIALNMVFQSDFNPNLNRRIALDPVFSRLRDLFSTEAARQSALDKARYKIDYLNQRQIRIVMRDSQDYPAGLNDLKDSPPWLFVEGSTDALHMKSVTAVGSRKVTDDGSWLASYLGYCLEELNAVTVSGLALGIDQIVHKASLAANLPTIAVLGSGILSDYPRGSEKLRQSIVEQGGAIITEYLPNDTVSAKNFVRRNRIQAALGNVVIPIEWSLKSGTAHTVKFASDLQRPLLFVRTPNQPTFDWLPSSYRSEGFIFDLPKEHGRFIDTVRHNLSSVQSQKNFFED
jgi:DNA processing protein